MKNRIRKDIVLVSLNYSDPRNFKILINNKLPVYSMFIGATFSGKYFAKNISFHLQKKKKSNYEINKNNIGT